MTGGAFLVALLLVVPPVAPADLGGYLERSAGSDYSGELLVSCGTPDGSRDAVIQIAQTDGWVEAWTEGEDSRVTAGQGTMSTKSGGEVVGVAVETGETTSESPAYEVGDSADGIYLGRPVQEVTLLRDGTDRVRLTVDDATDVVLRTEILDGNGDVYCDRRLLSFEPGRATLAGPVSDSGVVAAHPMEETPAGHPASTSGFELFDTYDLDDGTLSYYSDGFFSFGLVVTNRPFTFSPDQEVETIAAGRGEYRRSFSAGNVSVAWQAQPGNLALVGDLPPDLLEAVLADLPAPMTPGLLGRIWDRLFG